MFNFLKALVTKAKKNVQQFKPKAIIKTFKRQLDIKSKFKKLFTKPKSKFKKLKATDISKQRIKDVAKARKGSIEKQDIVLKKAKTLEVFVKDIDNRMRGKWAVTLDIPVAIENVVVNPDLIKTYSEKKLDDLGKLIDTQMKGLGIDGIDLDELSDVDYYNKMMDVAYNQYMENWKNNFFDSDTTEHLEEDVKNQIWDEIVREKSSTWFSDKKWRDG